MLEVMDAIQTDMLEVDTMLFKLDALLGVPRQSLYWEALAILQLG